MTSAAPRLSRVSTAIAIAVVLAAAPATAGPAFLKLGGVEAETARQSTRDEWVKLEGQAMPTAAGKKDFYEGWIELNSWSWGETQAAGMGIDRLVQVSHMPPSDPDRPLVAGRIPNAGVEREMKESGEKGGTEDINIGVGELQEATGKRQHKPMTTTKEGGKATPKLAEAAVKGKVFSSPAPRGSLTTLVPAGTCRVGARYRNASLETGAMRFEMENIMVSSCSAGGSGGSGGMVPTEQISLNYEKITTTRIAPGSR